MTRLLPALRACMGALALTAGATHASVVMNATRYIYDQGAPEITVKVSNAGKLPVLTQAWIDDGDDKATPDTVQVPFNLTPPISRLEAGKAQTLRVAFTGADLPTDIESLYWLNVLEVPPKAEASADSNAMQLAFRYRIKLFYRPSGLKGSPADAAEHLAWSRVGDGVLSVRNDSAFHVAVNDIKATVDGKEVELGAFSLGPRASRDVPPGKVALPAGDATIRYRTINDYGGFVEYSARTNP